MSDATTTGTDHEWRAAVEQSGRVLYDAVADLHEKWSPAGAEDLASILAHAGRDVTGEVVMAALGEEVQEPHLHAAAVAFYIRDFVINSDTDPAIAVGHLISAAHILGAVKALVARGPAALAPRVLKGVVKQQSGRKKGGANESEDDRPDQGGGSEVARDRSTHRRREAQQGKSCPP